jgi:5-methylcytosine-specific restriction protein A
MPTAPPRPCTGSPHCPNYQGQCPTHTRKAWDRPSPGRAIRGRKLQRLRAQLFTRSPLCVGCLHSGRTTIATIRDHVIPLAEGGSDTEANVQALCVACHEEKTQSEANRGIARSYGDFVVTVVCGPPGSGKTSYVERHRRPGVLVWDLDAMAQTIAQCPRYPRPPHVTRCVFALRAALIQWLRTSRTTAYIIVTDVDEAKRLAKECRAVVVNLTKTESP